MSTWFVWSLVSAWAHRELWNMSSSTTLHHLEIAGQGCVHNTGLWPNVISGEETCPDCPGEAIRIGHSEDTWNSQYLENEGLLGKRVYKNDLSYPRWRKGWRAEFSTVHAQIQHGQTRTNLDWRVRFGLRREQDVPGSMNGFFHWELLNHFSNTLHSFPPPHFLLPVWWEMNNWRDWQKQKRRWWLQAESRTLAYTRICWEICLFFWLVLPWCITVTEWLNQKQVSSPPRTSACSEERVTFN